MKIGIDFDNTIACYDESLQVLAAKINVPLGIKREKREIRDYLRAENREDEWTKMQGELYGPGMQHATVYENFIEACEWLKSKGVELCIISHRSKFPYLGERHDLHKYAIEWLRKKTIAGKLIEEKNIYFLETLDEKIKKINDEKPDIFIDDLIEVINHHNLSKQILGKLFSPNRIRNLDSKVVSNWKDVILLWK